MRKILFLGVSTGLFLFFVLACETPNTDVKKIITADNVDIDGTYEISENFYQIAGQFVLVRNEDNNVSGSVQVKSTADTTNYRYFEEYKDANVTAKLVDVEDGIELQFTDTITILSNEIAITCKVLENGNKLTYTTPIATALGPGRIDLELIKIKP